MFKLNIGNILYIGDFPPGSFICNIEQFHFDDGKLCRSLGSFSTVLSQKKLC